MRLTLVPSLFLVLAAGAAGAADTAGSSPITPVDDSGLSPAPAKRAVEAPDITSGAAWQEVGAYFTAVAAQSAVRDDAAGCLGHAPTLASYDAATIQMLADVQRRMVAAYRTPAPHGLGAATAAAADQEVAFDRVRFRMAIESAGMLAEHWQGTAALVDLTDGITHRGFRSDGFRLAAGIAIERLALDGEPVTGAIEGLVRVGLPIGLGDAWAVGPAITGRFGTSGDGLVVGWDAALHLEHALGAGIGIVIDAGVGQRAQHSGATSDIEPQVGAGIVCVF